jgi:protein-tyrosine phosphatase
VNMPARILFVCTGNVCRSVIAATLARRALGADFEVAGAGIDARPGQPADPYALAALATLGVLGDLGAPGVATAAGQGPATGSRRLTRDLLVHSELILTATAAHRDAAVALLPAASRRTFTLAEFARLVAARPVAATDLVAAGSVVATELVAAADLVGAGSVAATELVAARSAEPAGWNDSAERLRAVVADVARLRGQGAYVDPASEDIADPRRRTESMLACAGLIARLVGECATALRRRDQPAAVAPRHSH